MSILKNASGGEAQSVAIVKLEDRPGQILMVTLSQRRADGRREVLVGYLTWALFLDEHGQLAANGWPEQDDGPWLRDIVEATVRDLSGHDELPIAGGRAARGGAA